MGAQESKEEEDYFVLEHLSKITLKNRKIVSYYFIHPQKTPAIEQLIAELRNYFKIQYFASIKTLQQEMSFIHKNQIVKIIMPQNANNLDMDYLQNQKKVAQIMVYGKKDGFLNPWSKLAGYCENKNDFLTLLNSLEQKDSLQISPSNVLIADLDTKLLNRYRLNFQCNTHFKGRDKAKQDLLDLAKKFYPAQTNLISQFEAKYNLGLIGPQKRKMILQWMFKDSFYWQLVSTISRSTTNPKRLAYIRLALKDIYEAIKQQYKQRKKAYIQFYVTIELSEQQKIKLQKSKDHCILFTSFIKGYSALKEAKQAVKINPKLFIFNIQSNRKNLKEELDFGFLVEPNIKGQNVIFNIYNVFRVEEINVKTNEGTLLYGVLPMNYLVRQIPKQDRPKMTDFEHDLMRNYDYLQDLLVKVDSQATLLQLSGYHKEGMEVFDKKVDFIRKTNESQENMNKCVIKKGDALRISGDYETAQKQYESILDTSKKMKLVSQIHLAELYMQKGQDAKFDKLIQQIYSRIDELKEQETQQYFKARNLYIVNLIKKGKKSSLQTADKLLKELQNQVSLKYPNNLEGKPLVHDIYRSRATCLSKQGKNEEALNVLKLTLNWQLTCQGKTPNVALTQTLIQSVCKSSGNGAQLQKSYMRMSTMQSQIESSQVRFGSVTGINLNKSLINISL